MEKTHLNIPSIINLVADGQSDSFRLFYDLYYEQTFRFCYYFLKDKVACREVVSNVFLAIWQSRKQLSSISNIESYLYVVSRNEANRYLNSKYGENEVPLSEMCIQIESSSPEETLLNEEMETLLTNAINELPEKCRIIFLMARQDGMKTKEIAELLELKESTVRVQMKIAIEKIILSLKPFFPNLALSILFVFLFK